MKTYLLSILGMLLLSVASFAQCESDEFLDECASALGSHTFIKSFNTKINPKKKATVEYSYVFSKGSEYSVILCDQKIKNSRLIVNLYDRNHKLIGSSYSKKTRKHYPDLTYPCTATGVYYIEASFEGSASGCGVIILGFTKG